MSSPATAPFPASHRTLWTGAPNWASGAPFYGGTSSRESCWQQRSCCPQGLAAPVSWKVSISLGELRPGSHRALPTLLCPHLEVTVCTAA